MLGQSAAAPSSSEGPPPRTASEADQVAAATAAAMGKPKQKPVKLTELPDPPKELSFALHGQSKPLTLYRRQLIGTGGFARCYEALDNFRRRFALKVVNKVMIKNGKHAQKLRHEIRIQGRAKHPNIVELFGWKEDEDHVHILLELCPNRSLQEMVKARKRLTDHEARYFFKDLLLAVQYMHERNIIHRDLKLGNVFLSDDMHAKVGDFGLATEITVENERKKLTICGTPNYIAPEILTGPQSGGHSFEVDIWSLGVILYSMLIGRPPFQTNDVNKIYKRINELDYSFPSSVPIHDDARSLIESMLQREPERRPTIHDLLQHPYVNAPECTLERLTTDALTEPPELPQVIPVPVEPILPVAPGTGSLYQSMHQQQYRREDTLRTGAMSLSRSATTIPASMTSARPAYAHPLYESSSPAPGPYSDPRHPSPPLASSSSSSSAKGRQPSPTARLDPAASMSMRTGGHGSPDAAAPVAPPSLARARSYGHMAASLERLTSSSLGSAPARQRTVSPPLSETGTAALAASVPHIAPSLESRGPSRSASHGSLGSRYLASASSAGSSPMARSAGVPSTLSTSMTLAAAGAAASPRPASVSAASAARTRSPGSERFKSLSLADRPSSQAHPESHLLGASAEAQEAAVDEWHRRRRTRAMTMMGAAADQAASEHHADEREPRVPEQTPDRYSQQQRQQQGDGGDMEWEATPTNAARMDTRATDHRPLDKPAVQQRQWAMAPREAAIRSRVSMRPPGETPSGGSALGLVDPLGRKPNGTTPSPAPLASASSPAATAVTHSTPSTTSASSASLIQSMQRNLAVAFQYAQDVMSPLADLKLEALRLHGADAQPPQVYLVKCIDYCDKYGIGYQLTNGVTGVYFNDSTVLARAPNKHHIEYLYQTRGGGGGDTPPRRGGASGTAASANAPTMKRQAHTMTEYPPELEKKVTLLNHFCDYMDTHMVALPRDQIDLTRTRDLEFLIKFFRGRDEDPKCRDNVFRLSNQVFQMNFGDHSKLVLAQGAKMILFIDSDRVKHVLQLADLGSVRKQLTGQSPVGPFASKELAHKFWTRLSSVKDLVDRLWKKRIEAASARNVGQVTPSRATMAAVAAAVAESPAVVVDQERERDRQRTHAAAAAPASAARRDVSPTPAMREPRRTTRVSSMVAAAAVPPRPLSVVGSSVGGGGMMASAGSLGVDPYGPGIGAGVRASAAAVGTVRSPYQTRSRGRIS